MVLDSSALMALLLREPEAGAFLTLIEHDPVRLVSTATILETSMVASGRLEGDSQTELRAMLRALQVQVVPFTEDQLEMAMSAFRRFGKGHHAAGLNFGDCFSYALAASTGEPLLFKGNDFSRTDIVAVA